ncbi:MAG: hypothetical protein RL518_2747 [Pseudomonadota bacterium]|jgi:hypothetical protein
MNDTQQKFASTVLWASVLYFGLCGLSAIFYPTSWLFVAGLPTSALSTELHIVFGTLGGYLLALAFGAGIAALSPLKHPGVIITLLVGNILDFCVTLKAVVAQELPAINGGIFLAVAMTWAVLLGVTYFYVKRAHPTL